jgi:hypothetical protein
VTLNGIRLKNRLRQRESVKELLIDLKAGAGWQVGKSDFDCLGAQDCNFENEVEILDLGFGVM